MSLPMLDEASLDDLYSWLDTLPLSRPRKNIARDFSDGVLVAELVAHYFPRYVDLHCFASACSMALKKYNWETLNKRVFCKLNFQVPPHIIQQIVQCKVGAIELILSNLRTKIEIAVSVQQVNQSRYRSTSASRNGSTLSLVSGAEDSMSSSNSSQRQQQQQVNLFKLQVSPLTTNNSTDACEDLVPARLLYTTQQQLLSKEEEFRAMEARCGHLEKLLQLKDDRIQQLTQRLDRLAQAVCSQNNINLNPNSAPSSPRKTLLNR